MAADLADWTQAVNVIGGNVTISGTATVTISGTPAVTVTSGTINIGNTPAVTISGTPTVNVGNTPTVTVSGTVTVSISGTPTVNIGGGVATVNSGTVALNGAGVTAFINMQGLTGAGMALAAGTLIGTIVPEVSYDPFASLTNWTGTQFLDPAAGTLAASIVFAANNAATLRSILVPAGATAVRVRVSAYTSGTANCVVQGTSTSSTIVNIAGTPSVTITGTPTVNIGNTPTVTISGSIVISSITAGTVTFTNSSINITTPWTAVGSKVSAGGVESFTTTAAPAGSITLAIVIGAGYSVLNFQTFKVIGATTGAAYYVLTPATTGAPRYLLIPINVNADSTYTISWTAGDGVSTVRAYCGIHEVEPTVMEPGVPPPLTLYQTGGATLVPLTYGQAQMAGSVPVTLASDQAGVNLVPTRIPVFVSSSRAVGTYTFDVVAQQGGAGILVYEESSAGAGNVTLTISRHDPNIASSGNAADSGLLTSAVLSGVQNGTLAVYPAIAVVANVTASQVVGQTPRITAVVAGAALTFAMSADIVP